MNILIFAAKLVFILLFSSNLLASVKMGIVTAKNYVGDREVAWRMKIAGEKLGWKVYIDEERGTRLSYNDLDWVVCMLPDCEIINRACPNYLVIFHPFNYLDNKRRLLPHCEYYDGYLLTINDRKSLQNGLDRIRKKLHCISFYPTLYTTPYKKLDLNDLIVMVPVWGNRLLEPFQSLYLHLSQSGFTKFYGRTRNPNVDPQNYMGPIPFDGTSVIDVLQKHGIVFVFHSEVHNKEGIPSSRIFEAAAASAVIISDNNPFVRKHFGDTVFYVDTTQSGEKIFNQIQQHIQTIHNNPEMALEKAKKAHEIFTDNFTMENQLLELQNMNRKVLKHRRR